MISNSSWFGARDVHKQTIAGQWANSIRKAKSQGVQQQMQNESKEMESQANLTVGPQFRRTFADPKGNDRVA